MRFSVAVAALAAGAVAVADDQQEEQTVTVTEYTTYCPSATMSQVCILLSNWRPLVDDQNDAY